MAQPRAISFDMGYTLLEHVPSGPELYRTVLSEVGLDFSDDELREAHRPALEHYVRSTREGLEFEASMDQAVAFWTEFNSIILAALRVPGERHQAVAETMYQRAWSQDAWRPLPRQRGVPAGAARARHPPGSCLELRRHPRRGLRPAPPDPVLRRRGRLG